MNQQFIQSLSIDWNKIEDDSYLREIEAINKLKEVVFEKPITFFVGENGSGKTTLMNMLSGIYFPDEGQIFINGKEEVIRSPKDAFDLGIGMVHQHFKLIDVLSATENIILGLPGKLNLKEATKRVEEICQKYGFEVDPKQKIYDMSVSQKQTVEIVKVLYRGADILILDEPTAVLTPQETEKLFRVLRKMRDDGKAIVIITHKMHEVESLSDRVAVLRSGQYIGCMKTKDTNVTEMTNMMVGHTVTLNIDRPDPVNPKPRIEVEGLTVRNGRCEAAGCFLYCEQWRNSWYCRNFRLWTEGAFRSDCRTSGYGSRNHCLCRG